jgi:hypothetical protein
MRGAREAETLESGRRTRRRCETGVVVSEEDVRRVALALPGSFERPSFGGRPSWRTKPRMFAWIRDEPEGLVVWVESLEDKDALLASAPEKFFTTSHYDGQPIVLVRLGAVERSELTELVTDSWRLRAPRRLVEQHDGGREPG